MISSMTGRLFKGVLKNILPNRVKRMLLIVSLHARICSSKHPDKDIALKLNKVFALASSDEALLLPMQLSERIWREPIQVTCGVDNKIELNDFSDLAAYRLTRPQLRIASDHIVRSTPEWLHYGSRRQMKNDVMKLISNAQSLS